MTSRRLLGLGLVFIVAAAAITAALRLTPAVLAPLPAGLGLLTAVGVSAGLALIIVLLFVLMDQFAQDDARAGQDPQRVIQAFSQRTMGVTDEVTLATTTGEVLAERLKVRFSGWLILTAQEAAFAVRPVPGHGEFNVTPIELPRQNVLLRQLNQRREPVLPAEVEADAHYAQTPAPERQWLKQLGAEVYAPVFEAGLLGAILVIGPKPGRRSFDQADRDLVMLVAAQSAALLRAVRLQSEMRQMQATIAQFNDELRAKDVAVAKMDSSRSDFLAIASHELRTPITQLLGFADLLGSMAQDNSLDVETVTQVTESIVRACGRLNEVISQILDMAQLDVNALDLKFKTTSLDVILRQAIEPYVGALRDRRLALKIVGLKGLPPLQADEQRLVQAFNQLASNAIKYTPDGGRIEFNLKLLPGENNLPPHIQITVADSGIGIDPQYHQLIFDKFYRIGSSAQPSTSTTKFLGAGPGLGLPIAKGVIERHGGRIWVESDGCDPAKFPGSRFQILLPLKPPAFDPRALSDTGERLRDSRTTIPRRNPFVEG